MEQQQQQTEATATATATSTARATAAATEATAAANRSNSRAAIRTPAKVEAFYIRAVAKKLTKTTTKARLSKNSHLLTLLAYPKE